MITPLQKARILQLRGLGYSAEETAQKLGITVGQTRYWLKTFEKQARTQGDDETYIRVMADGLAPEILKIARTMQGIGKGV